MSSCQSSQNTIVSGRLSAIEVCASGMCQHSWVYPKKKKVCFDVSSQPLYTVPCLEDRRWAWLGCVGVDRGLKPSGEWRGACTQGSTLLLFFFFLQLLPLTMSRTYVSNNHRVAMTSLSTCVCSFSLSSPLLFDPVFASVRDERVAQVSDVMIKYIRYIKSRSIFAHTYASCVHSHSHCQLPLSLACCYRWAGVYADVFRRGWGGGVGRSRGAV